MTRTTCNTMAGNFAQVKFRARRQVHKTFGVPVDYYRGSTKLNTVPGLTARLHNKLTVDKGVMGSGSASIMDSATHVIFLRDQLSAFGIVPTHNDRLWFPDYKLTLLLATQAPEAVGPLLDKWTVSVVP